jgi:subtilase family serine protease
VIRKSSRFLFTLAAIVLAVNIVCQAQAQTLLTRHVREVVLNGEAQSAGRLPATQSMRLVLVLPHRNQAALDNLLKELYDPSSAFYRKFLTVEEFTARFGPSQEDYDSVIRFAEANGFTVVGTSRNRMNIDVTGSVASIERAFHLSMGVYQHPTENRTFFAPDREPTPDLAVRLWHIGGLDNYSTPKPAYHRIDASAKSEVKSNATTGSGPDDSFLGSDMRAAYYVDGNASATLTGTGQSLGLFEFLGTDLADLNTYYANVGQTESVPITLLSVDTQSTSCVFNGNPRCDDTEQTLDMTQALGMAPGMSSLVMYIGTGGLSGQTLDDPGIFNAMATASPLNAQLSCSWAWKPSDPTTDDVYFEEFAAQGQNLFVAAGDDGVWSANDFYWPADSVYVTAVGGTDLETTGAAGPWASETGWVDTGGGIGPDDFAIPSWQVTAAAGCALCSQTFRNGPDVAAEANFDFYVCADQEACSANLYGGTSFAAPMWAGYLALANEQYLSNGASTTLGFINPALYAIGEGSNYDTDFHDCLTGGNTDGCAVGYDLSTGWGSPNGNNLINALAGPAGPNFSLSASPNSVTITQGNNGTTTITITPSDGFKGKVTLSASGLPSGVTAGFSPNPATTSSTLTLTASATAATGTVTVTVKGVSGSLTNTTTLSLTVNPSGPTVTVSPTSLTFANTVVGATSAKKPVTLTNTGTSTLDISSIATSGDFSLTTSTKPCGSTLAAGKNCKIEVTFTPTQVGARSGQLTITDNSPSSPQTVALSGTGTAQATLTPASATYPARTVGTTSPAKVFTLHNEQAVALTSIVASTTGDFSISATTCAGSLAAKSTCTIRVVFTPTATGTRTGTLQVSDSAVGSPQTSSLTGTGK